MKTKSTPFGSAEPPVNPITTAIMNGATFVARAFSADGPQRGEVVYVSPRIDESTRTGMARVVLPNPDGRWRPGTFVRADLAVSAEDVRVLVPTSAVQTIENQTVVFVASGGEFVKRSVTLGKRTGTHCEVLSGLEPGEVYAATGTFILKAELGKAEAEHAH
jgi:cobalt-zinc-cadmium efflux system membrane fusion protein